MKAALICALPELDSLAFIVKLVGVSRKMTAKKSSMNQLQKTEE